MQSSLAAIIVLLGAAVMGPAGADRAWAQSAPPDNFVSGIDCPGDTGAQARFRIPGTDDLRLKFGAVPDAIWIDISLFNNNFAPGTFLGMGPFVPEVGLTTQVPRWWNLIPAETHYFRLNARFGNEWREVGRGSFETPNCQFIGEYACFGDGTSQVTFRLAPAFLTPDRPVQQQWIDLTLFASPRNPLLDNGFPPGTFIGAGPFPPSGTVFEWRGIVPARRHFYRVNLLHGGPPLIGAADQWEPFFSGSFVSLDCRDLPRLQPPDV
ncbi:MAG: hypothetical protein WEB52_00835 [Dehalococcoidia bacterium]